jgi:hypothetical protein
MAGTKRIALGALLFLSGLVLVIVGWVADNLAGAAVWSLLVLFGTAAIIWGAFAGLKSWWVAWRGKTLLPAKAAPPTPSIVYAHTFPPSPSTPRPSIPSPAYRSSIPGVSVRHIPDPHLSDVSSFLADYRPSERFGREGEFGVELAQAFRGRFGNEHVVRQVPVGGGRIDIQIFGVGVELKIAGSPGSLLRLTDQVEAYREHYGPNLIVVILDDTGGGEQVSSLRRFLSSQNVRVFLK